jgi:protein-tyrosine phosphatase
MSIARIRVLFICMGNICRSPTAEGVFRKLVEQSPLNGWIDIDSAGTTGAHAGQAPDPRAIEVASRRGYALESLRARQVTPSDFELYDYVIAMDDMNVRYLKGVCPSRLAQRIEKLLDYGGEEDEFDVPDPYYGAMADFEHMLDLIEDGCRGLLEYLMDMHRLRGAAGMKRDN